MYDEDYEPSDELREYAQGMEEAMINRTKLPGSSANHIAEAFQGFTVEEYRDYVRKVMELPVYGFEGMTYGEGFFKPMVSLVEYLSDNGFTVYISSGSERHMLRELVEGTLDQWIPADQIIGSSYTLTAPNQGDTANRDYDLGVNEPVILAGTPATKNLKAGKVYGIIDEIGKTPILVFGNSSGDLSMGRYAVENGGKAYMLLCDDTERDYGDVDVAEAFAQSCKEFGCETVSMKDEFTTIYEEDVVMAEETAEELDLAA